MTVDRVFYTNGNDVMVTDSTLTVNKKQYRLMGIINHGLKTIRPFRTPGLLMAMVGVLIAAVASVDYIRLRMPDILVLNKVIDTSFILMVIGGLLALVGLVMAFTVKTHYAVHISTAEGDADVIVSKEREYVTQIINALNRALKQAVG